MTDRSLALTILAAKDSPGVVALMSYLKARRLETLDRLVMETDPAEANRLQGRAGMLGELISLPEDLELVRDANKVEGNKAE